MRESLAKLYRSWRYTSEAHFRGFMFSREYAVSYDKGEEDMLQSSGPTL